MPRKAILVLAITCTLLSACGITASGEPTSTPAATSTPIATATTAATFTPAATPTPIVYDGEWRGTTDAGGVVEFTIVDNQLRAIRVTFGFSTNTASCNVDSKTTISPGLSLAGDGFEMDLTSIKITAVFDSPASAAGTLYAAEDSQRCKVTVENLAWTAQKEQ